MYDEDTSTVQIALQNANPTVFSDATIANILALTTKTGDTKVNFTSAGPDANGNVTVAAGSEVVQITSSDTAVTTIKPPVNAPVVIFQGKGGVIATINDGVTVPSSDQSKVDRVVVGSSGGDKIIVADAKNTKVILGSGDSSVTTGSGVDTVQAGLGNSTITGGSGDYAVVKLAGAATNYTVTVNNGHAVVTDKASGTKTDITKIQFVQLDSGKALVFAKDSVEAAIATLYHTAFGRDADAGGLDYWFDLGRAGASLKAIAGGFAGSVEFAPQLAKSNTDYIQWLYQNTFGRAGESSGVDYWLSALANGATRTDLLVSFTQIASQNIGGTVTTEAQVVGSVKIITGII